MISFFKSIYSMQLSKHLKIRQRNGMERKVCSILTNREWGNNNIVKLGFGLITYKGT